MEKIIKNNKGFTLIELLAVIVVLAIIMVIATQQVNKTINGSRANSFVESYQMLVKQVKTYIASAEDPTCGTGNANGSCLSYYDLSEDYELSVEENTNKTGYKITLKANTTDGKFKTLDLTKFGNYTKTSGDTKTCDTNKIASGATSCNKTEIIGTVAY